MGLIGRWEPEDMYTEVWDLFQEGLRPISICAILGLTLQEVYDILDDGDSYEEWMNEQYDEDLM
jgi:hypothetical protein